MAKTVKKVDPKAVAKSTLRDLRQDFEWLTREKMKKDLADDKVIFKRKDFNDFAPEYEYGITFVESNIAYEWLTRAIEAEEKLEELVRCGV